MTPEENLELGLQIWLVERGIDWQAFADEYTRLCELYGIEDDE